MTREEHLELCKRRALEYVDAGDLRNAVNSMISDLSKHEDTNASANYTFLMLGMNDALSGNEENVRKWIKGFN